MMSNNVSRHPSKKIIWQLWLFTLVSIIAGSLALIDINSRLEDVKKTQSTIEKARYDALYAVEYLRNYRVQMTTRLHGCHPNSPDSKKCVQDELSETDWIEFQQSTVHDKYNEIVQSTCLLADSQELSLGSLNNLINELESVSNSVELVKQGRIQANLSSKVREKTAKKVRSSLASLKSIAGEVIGGQHLAAAKLFVVRNMTSSNTSEPDWQKLRANFLSGKRIAQVSEDLQDLALASEQLIKESKSDNLISLKDNRLRQILSRLERNAIYLGEKRFAFIGELDTFRELIFGPGWYEDPNHQTIIPGSGGLYQITSIHFGEIESLNNALLRAEYHSSLCRDAERDLGNLVRDLRQSAAINSQQSLKTTSYRLLLVAGIVSLFFIVLALWAIRLVSKAVDETAKKQLDLNDALLSLKTNLEAFDRVQMRVEFTPDGIVQEVNQLFEETMGYEASEVVGDHHRKLVDPALAADKDYLEFWQRLRDGQFQIGEFKRLASDGTIRWLHATYTPIPDRDGNIVRVLKYATDVTDRILASKKSEEATKRAKELARLITESPNELYIINKKNSYFEEINQGAVNSSLYCREELLSMKIADICEELKSTRLAELSSPLEDNEQAVVDFITQFQRKDESTYPVRVSLHRANYKNKEVLVAFVTDITEIQKLEDQLSRSQKLESIGQLAAGVAHEINTPMQFIGNNIEYLSECSDKLFQVVDAYHDLLNDDTTPLNWEDRVEEMRQLTEQCRFDRLRMHVPAAIEESREGVERTVTIVRAMREFSHPGEKEMKSENINHLIESAVAISRNRWKYTANLELELDPEISDVPMLVSEINQVLLNLIVNAGDAIGEKYRKLEGQLGLITVRSHQEVDHVVIEIEDDGCGIPDKIKQKIFDPFFTTKEVGKGTGQGLSITHNIIVNVHGGSVSIDSIPGEGSMFTIKIPRVAQLNVNMEDGPKILSAAR